MMGSVRADCLGLFPSYLHRIKERYQIITETRRDREGSVLPWKETVGSAGLPRPKRSSRKPALKKLSLLR